MPNHNPLSIANEFIELSGGPLNQMQLQKLVYIAHGWNLAINNYPLVSGTFEAWDGGPVMRMIWNHLRDFGFNGEQSRLVEPIKRAKYSAQLSSEERNVIQSVWNKYSRFSGIQLSEMTHQPGTPWSNAYFGFGRNSPLNNQEIRQHFTELAIAGRQKAG
jgi:uncharacterized phage-associated protein